MILQPFQDNYLLSYATNEANSDNDSWISLSSISNLSHIPALIQYYTAPNCAMDWCNSCCNIDACSECEYLSTLWYEDPKISPPAACGVCGYVRCNTIPGTSLAECCGAAVGSTKRMLIFTLQKVIGDDITLWAAVRAHCNWLYVLVLDVSCRQNTHSDITQSLITMNYRSATHILLDARIPCHIP